MEDSDLEALVATFPPDIQKRALRALSSWSKSPAGTDDYFPITLALITRLQMHNHVQTALVLSRERKVIVEQVGNLCKSLAVEGEVRESFLAALRSEERGEAARIFALAQSIEKLLSDAVAAIQSAADGQRGSQGTVSESDDEWEPTRREGGYVGPSVGELREVLAQLLRAVRRVEGKAMSYSGPVIPPVLPPAPVSPLPPTPPPPAPFDSPVAFPRGSTEGEWSFSLRRPAFGLLVFLAGFSYSWTVHVQGGGLPAGLILSCVLPAFILAAFFLLCLSACLP